ncbi:DUF6978 family protein [Paraburkholderia pallida]|uniref:Uncharacterized protein n=1 Tax=Paraburkholderia pallida TaxID=2547399 RepID=A0A4V1AYK3_9BURK|nr:hypothetical protein [Paraburkholderia pallida]QBQ96072.1 hypothetical protein E1956_01990 [Paraburkholderia pallida]
MSFAVRSGYVLQGCSAELRTLRIGLNMAKEDLTDARLSELIGMAKRVANPGARERVEGRHLRIDYRVVSVEGSHEFSLFTRQSTRLRASYSAGLRWLRQGRESVMLVRCNGPSHEHTNALEGDKISFGCHIHIATAHYLCANRSEEGFAEPTRAYANLAGALSHLVEMCNIRGFGAGNDPHSEPL